MVPSFQCRTSALKTRDLANCLFTRLIPRCIRHLHVKELAANVAAHRLREACHANVGSTGSLNFIATDLASEAKYLSHATRLSQLPILRLIELVEQSINGRERQLLGHRGPPVREGNRSTVRPSDPWHISLRGGTRNRRSPGTHDGQRSGRLPGCEIGGSWTPSPDRLPGIPEGPSEPT
jgi:hypothetical protein